MSDLGPLLHDVIEASLAPLDVDAIVERRRRHRRHRRVGSALAAAAAVVAVVGFSVTALDSHDSNRAVAVHVSPSTKPVAPTKVGPQRYEIDARVEQDHTHGPELCIYASAGAVTPDSSDCAGPAITNWDWAQAPPKTRTRDTIQSISGEYHLVGTYDGKAFTLTQPPSPGHEPRPTVEDEPAPCPTPSGGWQSSNPARHGLTDFQALQGAAQGAPDFAGMWSSSTVGTGPSDDFQHNHVTVVAYTDNLAAHRAELAALWGGPVCVVQHTHTYAELQETMTRINNDPGQLGLQILGDSPDEVHNAVRLEVIAATDATQRAIDRRFGPGLVKVSSRMKPIP
jgi:hypothetical protein